MMTDEGTLPDIIPKMRKLDRGLTMKLPPYSVGFWVVPEAKVSELLHNMKFSAKERKMTFLGR